jgi:hypothetical protein
MKMTRRQEAIIFSIGSFVSTFRNPLVLSLVLSGALSIVGTVLADGGEPEAAVAPQNFEECAARQGRVLKSMPPQCISADGKRFIKQGLSRPAGLGCKDLCGDGVCQEMVCMSLGCPCSETPSNCPKDCSGQGK